MDIYSFFCLLKLNTPQTYYYSKNKLYIIWLVCVLYMLKIFLPLIVFLFNLGRGIHCLSTRSPLILHGTSTSFLKVIYMCS